MGQPTGTQAVDRAAQLISVILRADEPLAFARLAEQSGLPKSTTHRLLTALERTGLVGRTQSGGYVAGPLFCRYATRHHHRGRPLLEPVPAHGADSGAEASP